MRILVLFDDERQLEEICGSISEIAPEARIAAFSKTSQASEYYQTHPVDVVFIDYAAKGIGSIPFSEGLKDRWPRANIIFCVEDKDVPPQIFNKIHCSGLILKPVQKKQIQEELENLRYPL